VGARELQPFPKTANSISRINQVTMNGQPILLTQTLGYRTTGLPVWKRLLDILIIGALLPAIVLIGGLVALIVKCGSPGPVLFRQRRVGYRGEEFTCLKFRTMKHKADTQFHQNHTEHLIKSQAPMVKLDSRRDPRLVPFGAALRATGLDELPQLVNVLRGEMSIVGPRPCLPYEADLFEPWHRRRFNAVPGLTGLWQVNGKNRTTFNQMVQLDIEYSERMSLGLDVKIILKTLPALWSQCQDTRALRRIKGASAAELEKSARIIDNI
jgi:lipopolysaccharide/colanic/teichoic acid biosynthesis glycosyltransferase